MPGSSEPANDQPDPRLGLLGSYGITPKNKMNISMLILTLKQIVDTISPTKSGTANLKKHDVERLQAIVILSVEAEQDQMGSNVTMEAFEAFKKQIFERLDGQPFVAGAAGTPDTSSKPGAASTSQQPVKSRPSPPAHHNNELELLIDLKGAKSDHQFRRADIAGKQILVNRALKDHHASLSTLPATEYPQILSLHALSNGNILLYFPSKEAAAWAKFHCKVWTQKLCQEACPRPDLVLMALDGVPLTFASNTDLRASILQENPLIDESDLIKVKWLSKTDQSSKTYGSMLLTFLSRDSAKRAYNQTIHISRLPCNLQPYIPTPTQCYKCQGFGHFATACRLPPKCAQCAGNHSTKDCSCTHTDNKCINRKECTHIATKCANCNQAHVSFD